MADIYKQFSKLYMEEADASLSWKLWYEGYKTVLQMGSICKDAILENPKLLKMIDEKVKIDAVIALSGCGAVMSHMFDTQLIPISPAGPLSFQIKQGLGNPINPMVQPSLLIPFLEPMTFFQRLTNIFLELVIDGWIAWADGMQLQ